MKLIESSIEHVSQGDTLENMYAQIERAGRICYASESKEGVTSKNFVDKLIKSGHTSVLEHGTIYLQYRYDSTKKEDVKFGKLNARYKNNNYSVSNEVTMFPHSLYITTNLRVLVENKWLGDLQYLCEPTIHHEKRYSFEVICPISVSREWNRHRTLSVSEQSTRYCNFSKNKFKNEISFIKPYWYPTKDRRDYYFESLIESSETEYFQLIALDAKPQEAREVLPLCTATKVFYTGFKSDWEHWLELRDSNAAHPDIRKFASFIRQTIEENDK